MSPRCAAFFVSAAIWVGLISGCMMLHGCVSDQPPGAGLDVGLRQMRIGQ